MRIARYIRTPNLILVQDRQEVSFFVPNEQDREALKSYTSYDLTNYVKDNGLEELPPNTSFKFEVLIDRIPKENDGIGTSVMIQEEVEAATREKANEKAEEFVRVYEDGLCLGYF